MRNILTLFLLLVAFITSSSAEPIKAVLVVKNDVSSEFQKPLSPIQTKFSANLSGEMFSIINPKDSLGENQNRNSYGESKSVEDNVKALAEHLDAPIYIVASIADASIESKEGRYYSKYTARMGVTLEAKSTATGATICSIDISEEEVASGKDSKANSSSIYNKLLSKVVHTASTNFLSECKDYEFKFEEIKLIEVAFGCNFPGADVSIDGVSYGTAGTIGEAPLKVKVSDGLHNVKISYPYTTPFEVRAKLQEGTTFMVVLRENEEGRKIRKEDTHFDALMDRIEKSGATDDQVRLLRARGYGEYLSSSYTRLNGMPQVLSMRDCEMPDFGLNPDKNSEGVGTSTNDLLNQAGSALGLNDAEAVPSPLSSGADDDVETDGDEDAKTNEEQSKEEKSQRERHDNTDVGVAIPLEQQQPQENSYTPVQQPVQPVQAPIQQSQQPVDTQTQPSSPSLIDGLEAVKTGVDTGKSIIEGIEAIGNILQ